MKRILCITSAILLNVASYNSEAMEWSSAEWSAMDDGEGAPSRAPFSAARVNAGTPDSGKASDAPSSSGVAGAMEWGSPIAALDSPWMGLGAPATSARVYGSPWSADSSLERVATRAITGHKASAVRSLAMGGSAAAETASMDDASEDISGEMGSPGIGGTASPATAADADREIDDIFVALDALAAGEITTTQFSDLLEDPEVIGNEQFVAYYRGGKLPIQVALYDTRIPASSVAAMIDAYPFIAQPAYGFDGLITSTMVFNCDLRSLSERRVILAAIRAANS